MYTHLGHEPPPKNTISPLKSKNEKKKIKGLVIFFIKVLLNIKLSPETTESLKQDR